MAQNKVIFGHLPSHGAVRGCYLSYKLIKEVNTGKNEGYKEIRKLFTLA